MNIPPPNPPDIPELVAMSATKVVSWLKQGKISSLELLEVLLERIHAVDPAVNALPTLCMDRARENARKQDDGMTGETLLCGLPVVIKDLVDVSGVRTTQGSLVYENHVAAESDILVRHLENRGGIVYAKSNTPEFGTGGNTRNRVFGMTRNPWNTALSCAGSSGGSAAALATGMAWLAHGSDMGGSLRNPASFCGVVGLRPTVGRVASTLGGAVSNTLSTNGPMARNVADLALMLDAMSGHEPGDPLSVPAPCVPFSESMAPPALTGKVAYSLDLGITAVDPGVQSVFTDALGKLEDAGIRLVRASPDFSGMEEVFHVLRAHSYESGLGELLEQHEDQLDPNVVWNIREGQKLTRADLHRAEAERVRIVRRVQQFFSQYPVLLTPATVVPPYPVEHNHVLRCGDRRFENYYQWLSIAYAFTTALCPALSMPCGFTDEGLPVGLQVAGAAYGETILLSHAARFEKILALTPITPINPGTGDQDNGQ